MTPGVGQSVVYLREEGARSAVVMRTRTDALPAQGPRPSYVPPLAADDTVDLLVSSPLGDYWMHAVPKGVGVGKWSE